jgi:hypothetical protein
VGPHGRTNREAFDLFGSEWVVVFRRNLRRGTPYFTENPGDPFKAWDASGTFDWMPSQYITSRWEFDHRAANVPYFQRSRRNHAGVPNGACRGKYLRLAGRGGTGIHAGP